MKRKRFARSNWRATALYEKKGKGSFYIAQYPVRWIAQSASHMRLSFLSVYTSVTFSNGYYYGYFLRSITSTGQYLTCVNIELLNSVSVFNGYCVYFLRSKNNYNIRGRSAVFLF